MESLTKLMSDIPYAGDQHNLSASFNPLSLLPSKCISICIVIYQLRMTANGKQ